MANGIGAGTEVAVMDGECSQSQRGGRGGLARGGTDGAPGQPEGGGGRGLLPWCPGPARPPRVSQGEEVGDGG